MVVTMIEDLKGFKEWGDGIIIHADAVRFLRDFYPVEEVTGITLEGRAQNDPYNYVGTQMIPGDRNGWVRLRAIKAAYKAKRDRARIAKERSASHDLPLW